MEKPNLISCWGGVHTETRGACPSSPPPPSSVLTEPGPPGRPTCGPQALAAQSLVTVVFALTQNLLHQVVFFFFLFTSIPWFGLCFIKHSLVSFKHTNELIYARPLRGAWEHAPPRPPPPLPRPVTRGEQSGPRGRRDAEATFSVFCVQPPPASRPSAPAKAGPQGARR